MGHHVVNRFVQKPFLTHFKGGITGIKNSVMKPEFKPLSVLERLSALLSTQTQRKQKQNKNSPTDHVAIVKDKNRKIR